MKYIKSFSLQSVQPTNVALSVKHVVTTGETGKTKEFNPVF